MVLPDYISRFYLKDENPFISLNMLDVKEAERLKKEHCSKYNIGGFYAEDLYLPIRRKIEKYIYEALLKKGGKPKIACPVYFSFGKMLRVKEGYRDTFSQDIREICINLEHLDLSAISFVHPDSMYECVYDKTDTYNKSQRTDTPTVYTYDELEGLIKRYGLYNEKHLYQIEAQVWDLKTLEALDETQYKILNF